MKNSFGIILMVSLMIFISTFNTKIVKAASASNEIRGVWVTTVENLDWPTKQGLTIAQQKSEMINNLDYIKSMNLNTMYFQVRSNGDAIYNSKLVPWSKVLTGTLGKSPGYDPLKFTVDEAHKRDIQFEAWFNPFRIGKGGSFNVNEYLAALPVGDALKNNPQWIINYNGYYCINPGVPEAREYVIDVIMEVVKNYDIDGVHLDDYFYPYGMNENAVPFNDNDEYQKYGKEFSNKGDWRRNNINEFVRVLNLKIKSEKPYVKFGISPFGIWKNGTSNGGSDTSGLSSYDRLYVDSLKWVNEGWVDYIAPQIYWNIGFKVAAYDKLVKWWSDNVKNKDVDLLIGHASYRVESWGNPKEIINQINLNRSYSNVNGSIFFRLGSLKENKLGTSDLMKKTVFQTAAQPSSNKISVAYNTHVQDIGWTIDSMNSYYSGTVGLGKRVEALKISLKNQPANLNVQYRAYVEKNGWQGWKNSGEVSGTEGKSLKLEALQVKLDGNNANKYDIEYQVHVQDVGWLPWVKNGETAGYEGQGKRVEAIKIRIYEKYTPIVTYQAHVQDIGWMGEVYNEETSGTVGLAKRVEAMKISIQNNKEDLSVKYRSYVQSIGWQPWVTNGAITGTLGKGLRAEAFQMVLEGKDSSKYKLQYQVHVQDIGWMPWTSNGEVAGTVGQNKRIEAIKIRVVRN
ncbi:MAG: family 10 glycosylhydrolase [Clostridiaceae bacterium]